MSSHTFECERCQEVTDDADGHNEFYDDEWVTICTRCRNQLIDFGLLTPGT